MATLRFTSFSTPANAFETSDLIGLPDGGGVLSTSSAIDNSTNRHFYLDLHFRLFMWSGTIEPTPGGHLAFYLLQRMDDGLTFPDSGNGTDPDQYPPITAFVGSMAARPVASSALNLPPLRGLIIPPGVFKFYVVNKLGVALPSADVAIACSYVTYSEETA